MALPLLSRFLIQTPGFSQNDPLLLIAEVLGRGAHDCAVVLTDEKQPIGLIRASQLLGHLLVNPAGFGPHDDPVAASSEATAPSQGPLPILADYPNWIQPVRLIAVDQPAAIWLEAQYANATPVVVDAQQRYLGLLDWERALPGLLVASRGNTPARDSAVPSPEDVPRLEPDLNCSNFIGLTPSGTASSALQTAEPLRLKSSWDNLTEAPVPQTLLPVLSPVGAALAKPCPTEAAVSSPSSASDPRAGWLVELNHEIKSPLTSLLGLSSLLQDPRLGSLTPRQAHYARLMYQTTRRLVSTINQLLDWFRLDAGQLTLFPAVVDTADLGPQVLRLLRSQLGPQDSSAIALENHFSWTIEPNLPAFVADPLRLRQMLYHLVSRALGHTEAPNRCGLQVECWGGWLALSVWDNGPSLDATVQATLLQDRYSPPAQAASSPLPSATPSLDRTSLGLILTWHLVRLHGGDLSFMASPAHGNRFTLLLPLVAPEGVLVDDLGEFFEQLPEPLPRKPSVNEADNPLVSGRAEAPSLPAKPTLKTKLILLASTDVETIAAIAVALQESEFRLVVARSPLELNEKAHRLNPALVLVDAQSPPFEPSAFPQLLAALPRLLISDDACPPPFTAAERLSTSHIDSQLVPLLRQRLAAPLNGAIALGLTVLYLGEVVSDSSALVPWFLSSWLHDYHCRVLEVDDLAQAEVLCRVWKPQVILLDHTITHPESYLNRLAQLSSLRSQPLVTLTPQQALAAQKLPQLTTIACPEALDPCSPMAASQLMESLVRAAARVPQG